MHKVIAALKDQLAKTGKNITEKGLSTGNLDEVFKLSTAIKNLECMEKGEWEPAAEMAEVAESVIKKYSNGRYDHNIDALYDAYIEAKKKYVVSLFLRGLLWEQRLGDEKIRLCRKENG